MLQLKSGDISSDEGTPFYTYRGKGGKRGRRELPQPAFDAIQRMLMDRGTTLEQRPTSSVPGLSLAGAATERRALNEDEVAKLLTVAEGARCDVPIRVALATGIRQSELLGLTWGSLDLKGQTLVVQQTVQHLEGTFHVLPPKTQRSRRTIELSRSTVALLRQHRATQNATRLQLGAAWHGRDLVFPAADGKPQYRRVLLQDSAS